MNDNYVLDKCIHIEIEKDIKRLLPDGVELLQKFINLNVSKSISKGIFTELIDSEFASYKSIPNREITEIPQIFNVSKDNVLEFSYVVEKNRNCKDIEFKGGGRVQTNDVEVIVKCIRDGNMFVTKDGTAKDLCECLGGEVINYKQFIEKIGLSKYYKK